MKMSEVFKLPLKIRKSVSKWHLWDNKEIYVGTTENCDHSEAILEAVNSHDTQLADMDRLLVALEQIREMSKSSISMVVAFDIANEAITKHKGE